VQATPFRSDAVTGDAGAANRRAHVQVNRAGLAARRESERDPQRRPDVSVIGSPLVNATDTCCDAADGERFVIGG
jgi:hypothetical protein